MNHWNGGENHHELTEEELDEYVVPLEHRATHVFKGAFFLFMIRPLLFSANTDLSIVKF
jgi:hypothetical protein